MRNIVKEVKDLNLPFGEYTVMGSGVLSVHGIREHNDIDLLITPKLYEILTKDGWVEETVHENFHVVRKGIVEASIEMAKVGDYNPDIYELIKDSDIFDDIPFVKLEIIRKFKKERGKEKDLKDLVLIENFEKIGLPS